MSKPKHTPGPWEATGEKLTNSKYGTRGFLIKGFNDEGRIHEVAVTYNDSDIDQANAALISVAPEMLKLLEQCLEIKNAYKSAKLPPGIEDVLAKARGES